MAEFGVPFLDVYHATQVCNHHPPKVGGYPGERPCNPASHSSWPVSMQKVHMILGWLCGNCERPVAHASNRNSDEEEKVHTPVRQ